MVFSQRVLRENWICIYKEINSNSYLTSYIKINSKYTTDLHLITKITEENIRESLCDFELDTEFLVTTLRAHSIKGKKKINWTFSKSIKIIFERHH